MGTRDVEIDFCYQGWRTSTSIVGPAGTYLAPNSIDTYPLGASLTALTPGDTILTVGGISYFIERDEGAGDPLKLVVDWVEAPVGGTSIDMQLITSASSAMIPVPAGPIIDPPPTYFPTVSYPAVVVSVVVDFGALPIAAFATGYRQITNLPRSASYQQYLGLQAITQGTITAGEYMAWLAMDIESTFLGYANGFPIK